GVGMPVALSSGGGVIETTEHVNVGQERGQRREARGDAIVGSFLGGDPVPLRDTVAIEPEHEASLDRLVAAGYTRSRSICRAVGIEHRYQRRQPDDDASSRGRDSLQ